MATNILGVGVGGETIEVKRLVGAENRFSLAEMAHRPETQVIYELPPSLEIVSMEMHLRFADLISNSFEAVLVNAAQEGGGNLLFNLRLPDDPSYQRAAAVSFPNGEVGIVFLTDDGLSTVVEDARSCTHSEVQKTLSQLDR